MMNSIRGEISINPGPAAWFLTQIVFEHKFPDQAGYFACYLGWWGLKDFKSWLWHHDFDPGDGWTLLTIRLLGFEVCWEHRKRV